MMNAKNLFGLLLTAVVSSCAARPPTVQAPPPVPPGMPVVTSLSALQSHVSTVPCVYVAGFERSGDGGGGVFCRDENASDVVDGATVLETVSHQGRWKRTFVGPFDVRWFGARCDGTTDDTVAVQHAIEVVARRAATLVFPSGQTCRLTSLDLTHPDASGITLAGGGGFTAERSDHSPSTLLFDPPEPVAGPCLPLGETPTDLAHGSGAVALGPNIHSVVFRELRLRAGRNLGTCLINASAGRLYGDVHTLTFSRVFFFGNGDERPPAIAPAAITLHRASWITVEHSVFAGFQRSIWEYIPSSQTDPERATYTTHPVFVGNRFYRAHQATLATHYAIELWDVTGAVITGNHFEYGPYGIYVGQLAGGAISQNWFNGENEGSRAGTWIDVGCAGCQIEGNYFLSGYEAIRVRGEGGSVRGNYFSEQNGIPMSVLGANISVMNNRFNRLSDSAMTSGVRDMLVNNPAVNEVRSNSFHRPQEPPAPPPAPPPPPPRVRPRPSRR